MFLNLWIRFSVALPQVGNIELSLVDFVIFLKILHQEIFKINLNLL